MDEVCFEVHWMNDSTGERGVLDRTYTGDLYGLRNAWYIARKIHERYPRFRHWVKTRPALAKVI